MALNKGCNTDMTGKLYILLETLNITVADEKEALKMPAGHA
jgi:hypothetical protein